MREERGMIVIHKIGEDIYMSVNSQPMKAATLDEVIAALVAA